MEQQIHINYSKEKIIFYLISNEIVNYENYAYIIKFLIENYEHEYLLKLISNENFARKET